jgi:hypothetical protein
MWKLLLFVLPSYAIQRMNYMCTSPFHGITHYYSTENTPLPAHVLTNESHCSKECSPCVWNRGVQQMVGYRSICVPSYEDQQKYNLVNRTFLIPYHLQENVKPAIYHSYGTYPFMSHTYLCVYSPKIVKNNEIEEEFPPDETSDVPLSEFPYSRFN